MNFSELEQEVQQILDFFKQIFHFDTVELVAIDPGNGSGRSCLPITSITLPREDVLKLRRFNALVRNESMSEGMAGLFEKIDADVVIPLGEGKQCFGILAITRKQMLTKAEIESGRIIAGYVSHIIDKFVLVEDLKTYSQGMERLVSELSAIHEISRAFDAGQNVQTLLEFIMDKCMSLMNAEASSLMLLTDDEKELEFRVALGPKGKDVKPFRLAVGKGIGGWVAATREPVLISDAYKDPRFDPSFDKKTGFLTRSILCVPMFYQDKTMGVMQIINRKDGQSFSEEDKMLFSIFATQAALSIENARLINEAIEKERMEKELEVAAEIQRLLIPKRLPDIPGLDLVAANIPCKQIGGDYYDVRKLDTDRYMITIADVSGKGVPAALVVSTMQASLKAYLKYTTDLVQLTEFLNQLIIDQTTMERYITFFISIYDAAQNRLDYVNAGHNPPFIFRDTEIINLKGGGIPLGFMPFSFEQMSVDLREGDLVLFYTDGLVETMNPDEEEFGEERIARFFQSRKEHGTAEILDELSGTLSAFRNVQVMLDDLTMIIMRKE